jgi:hypothetical protein
VYIHTCRAACVYNLLWERVHLAAFNHCFTCTCIVVTCTCTYMCIHVHSIHIHVHIRVCTCMYYVRMCLYIMSGSDSGREPMMVKATPKTQAKIGFMTPTLDDTDRFK